MGMAASQARLLSITARLTNNENTGQSISYSKQRLADQTQQITNEYNEALKTTKLTVLTGFNGAEATYTDISYNVMTSLQMAENTKQYIVTDTKGRILVSEDIADAYKASNGNYNQFLANITDLKGMGYSQSDLTVNRNNEIWKKIDAAGNEVDATPGEAGAYDTNEETIAAKQKIHEAWDAYFATVGINLGDEEHDVAGIIEFKWEELVLTDENGNYLDENGNPIPKDLDSDGDGTYDKWSSTAISNATSALGCGYVSYIRSDGEGNYLDKDGNIITPTVDINGDHIIDSYSEADKQKFVYDPINYEGTTQESRDLYDYAMAITEAYLRVNRPGTNEFNVTYNSQDLKTAANSDNASALQYYKNIFTKMQSSGYFTYTNTPADAVNDPEHYIYASVGTGTAGNVQKSPLYDNVTFEGALRDGTLRLEYFSTTDKKFVSTTISEDTCIQEVADERAIAAAESKYNQDMTDLENKDKKLDLELKKLDTEHSALQTEYDSVKNIVDKNVESSFKIFS